MTEGIITTSINEIIKYMGVPSNGKWSKIVSEELDCLYKTTISWVLSFYADESSPQTVKNQHILNQYNYSSPSERSSASTQFDQTCEIQFDDRIIENLRNKKTAPMNLSVRHSINSPVQRVLYDMVDLFLVKNGIYERTARNLVDDLNLSASRYAYKSKRKTLLEDFKASLDGKMLSTLSILKIDILKTSDGADWKCRFRTVK
ncbi:hypothetical protein [Thalassotalea agarivorans]|uniref:Initiator Replication protein n=1 Tax=Thalassotalea agarivorans TaxID=349064 RepID=A0A1I0GJ87_THASX|nr:hypothetical protein [Thalassotalea agarivorans]SET71083.1 hypothetical protein SAMN05660429_02464 [Thalassotalea agarivorans]